MADATIAGTISFPITTTGATSSVFLGAPAITSSSSSGATLSYNEGFSGTIVCPTGSATAIPQGTVASVTVLYVGTNQAGTLKLNGSADGITIAQNGFVVLSNAGITAATFEPTTAQANVDIVVLGD